MLVSFSSPGPILFRQKRIGLNGVFLLYINFELSETKNNIGSDITASNDQRITKVGNYLRILKLDELPQLWNIINKTMSFVGPRPEVKKYVNYDLKIWKKILSVRPGLTNPVMFELINEQSFLEKIKNKEIFYEKFLLPYKLKIQLEYLNRRTWLYDLKIIFNYFLNIISNSI